MMSKRVSVSWAVNELVGSSRIRTRTFLAGARAISTNCFWATLSRLTDVRELAQAPARTMSAVVSRYRLARHATARAPKRSAGNGPLTTMRSVGLVGEVALELTSRAKRHPLQQVGNVFREPRQPVSSWTGCDSKPVIDGP